MAVPARRREIGDQLNIETYGKPRQAEKHVAQRYAKDLACSGPDTCARPRGPSLQSDLR
jgi:hypothetical protein